MKSNIYNIDFSTGKLVPITSAGLLPVGQIVTYEDRCNPRNEFVVTGEDFGEYGHGQQCTCEDGHSSSVSLVDINGPGGWNLGNRILTPEEITAFLATASANKEKAAKEAAEKSAIAQTARATAKAKAIQKNPHLERVKAGDYASARLAAKNIRTELKIAFPGIKFSVTSKTFSGGDSVDINWELGPTTKEVEKITGKYQEGSFNGMEDIYEYDRENVWPDLFGGAKYVRENRHEGESYEIIAAALCDRWQIEKPADGKSYWNVSSGSNGATYNDSVGMIARQILHAGSYPAGAIITGIEETGETCGRWDEILRATFTSPQTNQAPAPTPAMNLQPGTVTITENEEKDGIEIRFPAKPAPTVLDSLKSHGFRWSRFAGCWYHKRTEEIRSFANSLANQATA